MAGPLSRECGGAGVVSLGKHRELEVVTTYTEECHRRFGLGGYFVAVELAAAILI